MNEAASQSLRPLPEKPKLFKQLKRSNSTKTKKYILSRRALERLDLLMLAIESIDLNGGESMVWTSHQLGLETLFPNRVELWKRRCHNPLRKATRRGLLSSEDSEALLVLVSSMAERLYPFLHQLLSKKEPSSINHQRWELFNRRLRELISERLNQRRGAVINMLDPNMSNELYKPLVRTLALSSGSGGIDRLRASLLDQKP